MRFRRSILASLAPLLSLSALVAAMAADPGSSKGPLPEAGSAASSLVRLLRSVVHFAAPAAEHASIVASPERPSPQAVLAFTALAETPFGHSVWMVASSPAVNLTARRHQRAPLRC